MAVKEMLIAPRAKVALTVGPAEISAEAAIDVAKANISNNTETTVQVSWSGGGFIKPSMCACLLSPTM